MDTDYNASPARPPAALLITGETREQRQQQARTLHYQSPRRHGPFIPVDCAALADALAADALFEAPDGAVQLARGGTLFLDQVQALPSPARAALLCWLRVGPAKADVHLVAAVDWPVHDAATAGDWRTVLTAQLPLWPGTALAPVAFPSAEALRLARRAALSRLLSGHGLRPRAVGLV